MNNPSSNFRLSPCPFIDSNSSSSLKLKTDPDFERSGQLYSEQIPYSKSSLDTRQTTKLNLNSLKRKTREKRTVSGSYCLDCLNYQKTIEELQQKLESMSQKFIVTEKHLKQYDNLLQIKDNRLKQQEDSLQKDLESFDKEKELFYWEKKKLEEEKKAFEFETIKIGKGLSEISNKNKELQILYEELEGKKIEFLNTEKNLTSIDSDYKQSLIISRESDIQRLVEELQSNKNESSLITSESPEFQKYLKQKEKNRQKKIELKKLAEEMLELREKFEAEQKQNFEELESRMVFLAEAEGKLLREKQKIEEMTKEINEKIETIDQLKSALLMQQETLEQEKKMLLNNLKRAKSKTIVNEVSECLSCVELKRRLTGLQEILAKSECDIRCYEKQCQNLQNTADVLESKLKIIECSREDIENENYDLQQLLEDTKIKKKEYKSKVKELEKIINIDGEEARIELEKIKKELDSVKKNKEEAESQNLKLSQKLQILNLRFEELENYGIDGKKEGEKIWELYNELQSKVEKIREKENEISELKAKVLEERRVIENATESLKGIHEDLIAQKKVVEMEKESNELQKIKILELDKKQQDKGRMLISKEKELNSYKEKLIERENLLLIKEKRG